MFGISLVRASAPDKGGYRWTSSDETGGPQFQWIDISGSGTRIPLGDDDNQGPLALGFGFNFYGGVRESVRVCSNGWLSFTSESHQFHHYPIPDTSDPNSLLAPLWADLDPSQGGSVLCFADSANGRFVVSWVGVPFHGTTDSCTFQVVLDQSGTVFFQYLKLPARGKAKVKVKVESGLSLNLSLNLFPLLGADSCSVGIENDSGTTGLEYLYNGQPQSNRLHDSLAVEFYRLQHDACPTAILRPMAQVLAGDSIVPLVKVWNAGLSPASFPVTLKIGSGYQEQMTVTGLTALRDTELQFPVWVPAADTCAVELTTSLAGDECPSNDTLRMDVAGSYVGELRYDDGEADTWFLRNGSPTRDWAGAARFSVPYSRFRLLGARVFVADTMPFARVLVCPDSSGAPQIDSPYLSAESVRANLPDTWLEVAADTDVARTGDLWLVAFWPRSATGPRIGDDQDEPIDGRSYFGSPTLRWFSDTTGDLMARLMIDGRTGIAEAHTPDALCPTLYAAPNPFRTRTAISLQLTADSPAGVTIFDCSGRPVRSFSSLLSPHSSLAWDGKDDCGRALPAGTYFIEARTANDRRIARVLLVE